MVTRGTIEGGIVWNGRLFLRPKCEKESDYAEETVNTIIYAWRS